VRRFVVLEHRRDGVHWDLMLEVGLALRTWAVEAPIVPGVDLPARALADHRLTYLDYEGEVSGGRGTVRRLDRGRFLPRLCSPGLIRVRLEGGQLVGEAELRKADPGPAETPCPWILRLGNFD